jgi:hypothetical protein
LKFAELIIDDGISSMSIGVIEELGGSALDGARCVWMEGISVRRRFVGSFRRPRFTVGLGGASCAGEV